MLAASLTDVDQLVKLAGVKHITISPPLLEKMRDFGTVEDIDEVDRASLFSSPSSSSSSSSTSASTSIASSNHITGSQNSAEGQDEAGDEFAQRWTWTLTDEARFRIAFTRRDDGWGERKQVQAINVFCDMQAGMEKMVRDFP